MHRIVGGVLVLLLATPALWAEDKPKDKPATPAEQYQALLKEYQEAMTVYQGALKDAKTPDEHQKIIAEKFPKQKFAPRFLDLAEKNPKDPVALDALLWVLTDDFGPPPPGGKDTKAKAIDMLVRDHVESEKLGPLCQSLARGFEKRDPELLRTILDKNPHKSVRADASLALAQCLSLRAYIVKQMAKEPDFVKQVENFVGKETLDEFKKADLAKMESESEKAFLVFADKYAADLTAERLISVCQQISFTGGKGGETLLRTLLEKDTRHDVQGVACVTLGQMLKLRADGMPDEDAKAAEKLREESEKLFERAADKFADVKLPFRGTVGDKAKNELFDIRNLSVGKTVPEVEGEDQDAKKFQLADYKGKVVMLDFWSEF
jgi:hypothetical protein